LKNPSDKNQFDDNLMLMVRGVSKKFARSLRPSMLYGATDIFRNMLGLKLSHERLREFEFWALQNISFDLKKGEALGIIGENGSGKSTLLRILTGIFPPNHGDIFIRGKIGALIALGAGFHPHFSGRENVYINGALLGMTAEEIEQKFQMIVEFAEIGEFIDAPVSTYSSGMTVRLGFSIAIHCDVDVLIADEILAVGDLSFTLKCYRKFSEFREKGGTTLLVSHSLNLVRNVCQKVLWLEHGKIMDYGDAHKVCNEYEARAIKQETKSIQSSEKKGSRISLDPLVKMKDVLFLNSKREKHSEFLVGESLTIRIHYAANRKVTNPLFSVSLINPEGVLVFSNFSHYDGFELKEISGEGFIDFTIKSLDLKPSTYYCTVVMAENDMANNLDWHEKAYAISVVSDRAFFQGLVNPKATWSAGGIIET
jgi:lipopolysaccharide transport system ATP-binding protein